MNFDWHHLNERERWMVGFCAVFCALAACYWLLIAPIQKTVATKSEQLSEKQATLSWMKQVRGQSQSLKAQATLSNTQLLSLLVTELRHASFQAFPYELQQTNQGDVQLSFQKVPYSVFVPWLWSVSKKYPVAVKQLNVEQTDTPGVVKIFTILAVIS